MAVDSMVSGGCIVSGSRISKSLLFTGVHVHSFGELEKAPSCMPYCLTSAAASAAEGTWSWTAACVIPAENLVVGEDPGCSTPSASAALTKESA